MPVVAHLVAARLPFALPTIVARDGGPRPVGRQTAVTVRNHWGFVSGGCVEADVSLQRRGAMREQPPRLLAQGSGSPFVDVRLPK